MRAFITAFIRAFITDDERNEWALSAAVRVGAERRAFIKEDDCNQWVLSTTGAAAAKAAHARIGRWTMNVTSGC